MDNQPLDNQTPPEPFDRREARAERRAERRSHHGGGWIGGAVLIGLGLYFLAQNFFAISFNNWWALFILIPAVGAFTNTYNTYQDAGGRLTGPARGSLIGGTVLTMVAVTFLFSLNWGIVGPLLLILAGVGLLLNVMLPGSSN